MVREENRKGPRPESAHGSLNGALQQGHHGRAGRRQDDVGQLTFGYRPRQRRELSSLCTDGSRGQADDRVHRD